MADLTRAALALSLIGTLAACERPIILSGQRFDLRTPLDVSLPAEAGENVVAADAGNQTRPVALGAAVANAEWTHRAGNATHQMPHVALSAAPQRLWTAPLGAGNSRRFRITAAPVVGGGRIYAMDAGSRVSAVSPAGAVLWAFDVTPPGERGDSASGGGLAYADGRLFVATGWGELLALDAATGALAWRQRFDSPVAGAPTVSGGTVYVTARDGGGWAVTAEGGRQLWVLTAVPAGAGRAGAAAPAVSGDTVVFPFGSTEVIAATRRDGGRLWAAPVAGNRPGRAVALVTDITGDPVVAGNTVYVGSAAGRTAALDLRTGARLWDAAEGAAGPVWLAGGSLFQVGDDSELLRLDAATGEVVWRVPLPGFLRDNPRRQKGVHSHHGPVLAGGRVVVASSDGRVRFFAPESGAETGSIELPGGAAAPPAVAGGVLYLVSASGQLHAFR